MSQYLLKGELMKRFLSLTLLVVCALTVRANELNLKPHEQWWEKNVDAQLGTFAQWLGDINADSRVKMRKYISSKGYKSILDIPCGLCTEFYGYERDGIAIDYYGVDITPKLVSRAKSLVLNVIRGSIEEIPFEDSSIDVCYARHILEHLDYYEKAVNDLIRVASKEVIVIFFIKPPIDKFDDIRPGMIDGALLYHNVYNRSKIEQFLNSNIKVIRTEWQDLNPNEVALHIYV